MSDLIKVEITKEEWEAVQARRTRVVGVESYNRGLSDAFNAIYAYEEPMLRAAAIELVRSLQQVA